MFRGRGRGRGSSSGGFNNRRPGQQDPSRRGLFVEGIWLCDCTPRLPAEHFKVKKEGRNQGRWFYTCQNSEGKRCGFFLWDDDAKPREEAAVLSGHRNEPKNIPAISPISGPAGRPLGHSPARQPVTSQTSTQSQEPPPYSLQHPQVSQASSSATYGHASFDSIKKKRPLHETGFEFDVDDGDSFPWDLTGREADELERYASLAPETPRKATKTTAYATPATTSTIRQLPWLDYTSGNSSSKVGRGLETPSKSTGQTGLPTPSLTKPFAKLKDTTATPTPSPFRDAISESPSSYSLVDETFDLLRNSSVSLTPDVSTRLRVLLNKHELKAQGISKGRDMVRLALKAKDAKLVELTARVAALEAERELDRARIRALRSNDSSII